MSQNMLFAKKEIIGTYINNYINRYKNFLNVNSTVLITGETGTGKELIARWIHYNDIKRCNKPFFKISIPNVGENIFESEVFGYVKGAFTGATAGKKGLIETAEDGTIFFDEIENATPSIQGKLLQLLEDNLYIKVGDTTYQKTSARFIVATNKDLYEEVLNNRFRADLYYRLAVLEINLPPLKDRKKDILEISNHFIGEFNIEINKDFRKLNDNDYKMMILHNWPGNVRELKNTIEKGMILSEGNHIDFSSILSKLAKLENKNTQNEILNYKEYMESMESDFLKKCLIKCSGNIVLASKQIHMSIPFLYKKIKKYNIKIHD